MRVVSDEHKKQKRKEVLSSALTCFATKGYGAATIDDIVNHSGISKGAIYSQFKSKEEIYIELMYQRSDEIYDNLLKKLAKFTTALDKLIYLYDGFLEIYLDPQFNESALVQFEFQLSCSRREDLMKILENSRLNTKIKIITDILKEGIKSGEFKKEINIEIYSEIFWAFVDGLTTQKLLFPDYPYQQIINEQKITFINKVIN